MFHGVVRFVLRSEKLIALRSGAMSYIFIYYDGMQNRRARLVVCLLFTCSRVCMYVNSFAAFLAVCFLPESRARIFSATLPIDILFDVQTYNNVPLDAPQSFQRSRSKLEKYLSGKSANDELSAAV